MKRIMKEVMDKIPTIKILILSLFMLAGHQGFSAVCNISGWVKQSGQIKINHAVYFTGQNVDTVVYTDNAGNYSLTFQAYNDFESFDVYTIDCIRDTVTRSFEYQNGITNYTKNFDLCPSGNRVYISGTVLNNGSPAEGVVVSFYVNQTYKLIGNAITAKDGTYSQTFNTGIHKSGVIFSKLTDCYGSIVMQNWLFETRDSIQIDYESCRTDPFPFIGGRILNDGLPVYANEVDVHLFRYQASTQSLVWEASQPVGHGGSYLFSIRESGSFLVKAIPASAQHRLLPEYYGDVNYWDEAQIIKINGNPEPELDIHLDEFHPLNGTSSIRGVINYYPIQQSGSPMSEVPVLLLNSMKEPMAFSKSNSDGQFEFDGLTSGQYYLVYDQVGIPYHPYPVYIAKSGMHLTGVEMVVTPLGSGLSGALSTEAEEQKEFNIRVYPNPTQGKLRVLLQGAGTVEGELVAMNGQVKMIVDSFTGVQMELDLTTLENGIYFLKLRNESNEESIFKVIKN
ncbi:T9SS type A sorting domain-containing protein [bacterium SCSIO 12741]|nr:T9SS type A sorting domain-containing protein [bacterium SCSIO 12741]